MFVDEMDVIGFRNKYDLPVVKSKCPVDGYTKRQYAKDLLRQLNQDHPGVKERMFHAILTRKYIRLARAVHPTERKRLRQALNSHPESSLCNVIIIFHPEPFQL